MERFQYFDHTSEMKFQAYGKTMDEAFGNAALAMTNFVTPVEKIKVASHKKVHVIGTRLESMLYDFLEEVLFFMDTVHFLTAEAEVRIAKRAKKKDGKQGELEEVFELTARLGGDDADVYPLKGEIKAITYNDMRIEEKDGRWVVQVVTDI